MSNGTYISKSCGHVRYPNHPQPQHWNCVVAYYIKTIRTSAGSTTLYPHLGFILLPKSDTFSWNHASVLISSQSESWHSRSTFDVLREVYDGQIWKDFMNYDGWPFLALPYNFMLSLNVDWFQPFKRTTHSTGVMYVYSEPSTKWAIS